MAIEFPGSYKTPKMTLPSSMIILQNSWYILAHYQVNVELRQDPGDWHPGRQRGLFDIRNTWLAAWLAGSCKSTNYL